MSDSRILIRNIFHMLSYAFRVLNKVNYASILTEDFDHVEDLFAAILSRGISTQLKQGLYKSYNEMNEQTNALRGKLHPYETKRLMAMRIQKIDCSYDEFSEDNILNQILRATSMKLIACSEVSLKYRKELRSEMRFFHNVSDIELSSVQWGRLQYHRNNKNYEMLMNICQFAWKSLLPSETAGDSKFTMFDEDNMPRQHFPMLRATDKGVRWDIPDDTDPSTILQLPGMHTDITLRHGGKTLIIDAKYYQKALSELMGSQLINSNNLYQIYAYVKNEDKHHTGNVSGMLLYARTTEESYPSLSVPIGGNLIQAGTLDLNRDFSQIAYALDKIARDAFGEDLSRIA